MDNSNGPGSHFVGYYNKSTETCVYYFDSYGTLPPKNIEKYLKSSGKQIQYNSTQYQKIDSILCGYYCYYVINELSKGKSFYDVLSIFDMNDLNKNEQLIKKYFIYSQQHGGGTDNNDNDSPDLFSAIGSIASEVLPELLPLLL